MHSVVLFFYTIILDKAGKGAKIGAIKTGVNIED